VLEGQALDQLSADEVYVLAKTLPNFSLAQKREAYRAILGEALEGGHAQSAESLELLKELRGQLGLTEADHHGITESLGIQDPALLDPEVRGSVELRVRRDSYRRFLVDLVEQRCPAGVRVEEFLATAEAIEAAAPVRTLFGISDEDQARIVSEISGDDKRVVEKARGMLEKFRELEIIRFSLVVDPRPEALLIRHTLRLKQRGLIREIVTIVISITDLPTARSFAQSLYVLRGDDRDPPTDDLVETAPVEIRDAFVKKTADPVLWSYLDVIDGLKAAGEVFVQLAGDRDPVVAALAISAIAGRNREDAERLASDLTERVKNFSPLTEDALAVVRWDRRSETIEKMAELLAAKVFTSLDLDSLAQIARQSTRVSFTAGEQICRFGDSPDSMFVLVRGETEAFVEETEAEGGGGRTLSGRAKPGAIFGELGVVTGRPRAATIEVASATAEVIKVPREVINSLLDRDLHATRAVLSVVSSYVRPPASSTGITVAAQ
jgi:CRP-like cAMP-binding protein